MTYNEWQLYYYYTLFYIISLRSVSSPAVWVCFCSLNADDIECVLIVYPSCVYWIHAYKFRGVIQYPTLMLVAHRTNINHTCIYIWYVNVIYLSYTHTSACQLPCWPTLITVFILYCIILYTLSSIYYTDLYGLYVICRGHSSRPEWRNGWWVAARGRLIAASFLWGLHGSETYITYIVHIYIYELVLDRHNVKRKHVMVFRLIWMKKLLEISIVWLFVIFQIFGRCWGHQSTILCGFGLCLLISTQTLDWWPRSARTCH